jgi:glycosyltransferase involved in cell wall biosynthesis
MNTTQPHIKFSIVTPSYNAERFIAQTISSVVNQEGDFDVEYILIDNESTDNTINIVEDYRKRLHGLNAKRTNGKVTMHFASQKDSGMYEAINRGLAMASGNIFAWINADDYYLPGAFNKIANVFARMPEVKWLKGITSYVDVEGKTVNTGKCYLYSQDLIRRGLYGREAYFIQQDSVFWRSELWRSVGGLDKGFKLAGDFDLWRKFAHMEPLYSLKWPISCFRRVKGQLSEDLQAYREEQSRIGEGRDDFSTKLIRKYFSAFEPRLPDWLNFMVFRLLRPLDPLYFIDIENESMTIKTSRKYVV